MNDNEEVRLCGVHPTAESNSAVFMEPWRQNFYLKNSVLHFAGLWLLVKEQSGNLLCVNTSIYEGIEFKYKSLQLFTFGCHFHRGVRFFELFEQISWKNGNRM